MPVIFQYFPALALYGFAFLAWDLPDQVHLTLSSLLPIAQLIDPIMIFVFIREYRSVLFCFKKPNIQPVLPPISVSSNIPISSANQILRDRNPTTGTMERDARFTL